MGYVRLTRAGRFSGRAKDYHAWCKKVRLYAARAGVEIPLAATAARPMTVRVKLLLNRADFGVWTSGRLPDSDNIAKGIADALCYISPATRKLLKVLRPEMKFLGDKFVDCHCGFPIRCGGREETTVEVTVSAPPSNGEDGERGAFATD